MCWKSKLMPQKLVAKRDIPIVKILAPNMCAYFFRGFQYDLNKRYLTKLEKPKWNLLHDNYIINHGFHSYSKKVKMAIDEDYIHVFYPSCGVYMTVYSSVANIVNGIIPKGSHYYLNDDGEYVSDSIIITKI